MQWINDGIVGMMLLLCAIKDFKKREVSLWSICIGGIGILGNILVSEGGYLYHNIWGIIIGGCLLIMSKVTGGQLGMGDALVFCITGIGLGFWNNINLLLWSLCLAAIWSIVWSVFHGFYRKRELPFLPFVCLGYIGVIFL